MPRRSKPSTESFSSPPPAGGGGRRPGEGDPTTCLGQSFPSDAARRAHFTERLRTHLADPAFRAQPGFPSGSDDDLLAHSDPPYFTACPNPFLSEFLTPGPDAPYERGPFAADSDAGKTHPIYTAHAYHSKVPHEAIMPYVLHFTAPGDVVLDGFAGSGMTGVAAQLCASPEPAFQARLESEWAAAGHPAPEWGARRAALVDLSPVAGFIGYNLNLDADPEAFERAGKRFFERLEAETSWMYETRHPDGRQGRLHYTVWSELLACPRCGHTFPYVQVAHDPEAGNFKRRFACPGCGALITPRQAIRQRVRGIDPSTGEPFDQVAYVPVALHYSLPGERQRHEKAPDAADLALLERLGAAPPADWFPTEALPLGEIRDTRHLQDRGIKRIHHFYFPRALHALAVMWRLAHEEPDFRARQFLVFMVEQAVWGLTKQNRYGANFYSQANRFLGGVYYLPPACSELSPWALLQGKYQRLLKLLRERRLPASRSVLMAAASTPHLELPPESVDYVFTDPPFGDAIKYGDLNLLIEAWHRVHARLEQEVLWDPAKRKELPDFEAMLQGAFSVYFRALKPGRWMTVVFHNSNARVWDAIQDAILNAGFVVADVRTLDRKQGSFNQVTAAGAVKNDLVISAYKPAVSVAQEPLCASAEAEVWRMVADTLAGLAADDRRGRSAQMLYSRMVAEHLRRGLRVPLSAPAFYEGLAERFKARDGAYYLA